MKNLIIIMVCFFALNVNIYAVSPEILWWADTYDSCFGNAAAADIDGDGKLEIVFSCYRNDSCVYALNAEDGSLLWKVNTGGCNDAAPIIYDVDGDNMLEVILASSCISKTFCISGLSGEIKWSTLLHGSDSPPTIADIDMDGKPEILHGNFGGYVSCLNGEDGTIVWDLLVDGNSWIQTAPAILDADMDGNLDFVVANWSFGTGHRIFCFRANDQSLLWFSELPDNYMYHGAAHADIDNDGYKELVIGSYDGVLLCLNAEDGSLKWQFSFPFPQYIGAPVTIADLNNDGFFEIAFFSGNRLGVLDRDGILLWEFEIPNGGQSFRGCAVSDVNNNNIPDLVFGTSKGGLYALNGESGEQIFDLDLYSHYGKSEFDIDHAPIIADFNGDGMLDIFLVGGHAEYPEIVNNYGRAYAVTTNSPGAGEWLMFRYDTSRSATVPILPATGIGQFTESSEIDLLIYPNPVISNTKILVNSKSSQYTDIYLTDILGKRIKVVFSGIIYQGSRLFNINTSGIPAGIYILKLVNDSEVITGKVIVME